MGLFGKKKITADAVAQTLANSFWREWGAPGYVSKFCTSMKITAPAERVLIVMCAHLGFQLTYSQISGMLHLESALTAQIYASLCRHLADLGAQRGYWAGRGGDAAIHQLAAAFVRVWSENVNSKPNPAWYLGKAMLEAITNVEPASTDVESIVAMSIYVVPADGGFPDMLNKFGDQFAIVSK